jgi:hypothetical protein
MTVRGRRDFLKGGSLAAGVLVTEACSVSAASPSGLQVAAFGWEVSNLFGNGADVHFKILNNMMLHTVNVDLSAAILSADATGFAEILCVGGVSRQTVPTFDNSGGHAYINFPVSSNFGAVTTENPNNLTLFFGKNVQQDQFLAVILKTWVPADGTASATARQVLVHPSLNVNAGGYLVFHMDHAGVSVDAEMQVVITYALI